MTKDNLEGLLDIAFEMEGLITLMLKREDMTPDKIKSLLQKKANSFIELIQGIDSPQNNPTRDNATSDTAASAVYEEIKDVQPQPRITPQPQHEYQSEYQPISQPQPQIPPQPEYQPISQPQPQTHPQPEYQPISRTQPQTPPQPQYQPQPEYQTQPQLIVNPVSENETPPDDETKTSNPPKEVLNDILSRKSSILTLNDKFRFRRDLFHNDDVEMENTLGIISRMKSIDEVLDYLYNDLCLDSENEAVIDLVGILSAQFS